jgi:histidine triad (HIT) family protein
MATLFERIITGEIPATVHYEDAECIVIADIAPIAPVHLLVIPKLPIASLAAAQEQHSQLLGHCLTIAAQMAKSHGVDTSGYRVVTNVAEHGGQTVPHLHFHVLGGNALGGMASTTTPPKNGALPWAVVGLAILLAIVYNAVNPKSIPWIKPEYTRDTLKSGDINRYITPTSDTVATAQQVDNSVSQQARDTSAAAPKLPTADSSKRSVTRAFVAEPGVIREINKQQFMALKQQEHVLYDARIPESYAKGHIPGALNVDGSAAESPEVIGQLLGTPRDRIILIYCDGGECELSHHIAAVLKNFSFGPIFIYTGGWAEWSTTTNAKIRP